jgi:hypothetical protein
MSTIRVQALPKFPASVEAGDGITVTRSGGVFTFSVDPDHFDGTYARLDAANVFTAVNTITVAGNAAQLNLLSGSSSKLGQLTIGRTGLDLQVGVAGVADHYFAGTASGDAALRSVSGSMFFGSGSNIGIKIGTPGSLTFPQHIGGALSVDGSGNVTAGDLAVTDGGTGSSTASGARTNLGLVIGTDVQAYDADLAAIAGLTSAANKVPFFTGSGIAAVADFSAFGRSLVDDADAVTGRSTLGLGTAATQNIGTSGANLPFMNGTNGWSAQNTFTLAGQTAVVVQSGSATSFGGIAIGRTGTELLFGTAGATNDGFTGVAQSESFVRGNEGLWLGSRTGGVSAAGIKIAGNGALTFPQHVSGIISTDGSGVVSVLSSSGTGNVARVTSPSFTTPALGAATGTSLTTTGVHVAFNATAIPAGGTAGAGFMFSSTANFGIFFGSGAPSLSAAKGSIYMRSDGSGTGDRIFVNTNGSTAWTAVTTTS